MEAAQRPVVLVLDDVHWAARPTRRRRCSWCAVRLPALLIVANEDLDSRTVRRGIRTISVTRTGSRRRPRLDADGVAAFVQVSCSCFPWRSRPASVRCATPTTARATTWDRRCGAGGSPGHASPRHGQGRQPRRLHQDADRATLATLHATPRRSDDALCPGGGTRGPAVRVDDEPQRSRRLPGVASGCGATLPASGSIVRLRLQRSHRHLADRDAAGPDQRPLRPADQLPGDGPQLPANTRSRGSVPRRRDADSERRRAPFCRCMTLVVTSTPRPQLAGSKWVSGELRVLQCGRLAWYRPAGSAAKQAAAGRTLLSTQRRSPWRYGLSTAPLRARPPGCPGRDSVQRLGLADTGTRRVRGRQLSR